MRPIDHRFIDIKVNGRSLRVSKVHSDSVDVRSVLDLDVAPEERSASNDVAPTSTNTY